MTQHAEYLAQQMGFDSPSHFDCKGLRAPSQADFECNLTGIGTAILSALLPGTVTVGTAAAATGALGVVTATTATIVGGAAVAAGVTGIALAANAIGQSSGRAAAYDELSSASTTEGTSTEVTGVSAEEQRRRAALAKASNNSTNVLTDDSSTDSSIIKSTLGGTDISSSIIG